MSEATVTVTDDSFEEEVLNADLPVLVDFWAPWCGPCKIIAPIIEGVAAEHSGKLKVVKVDVDVNPETAAKYGVRGIPTLLLIKGGNVVMTKVGALTRPELNGMLKEYL